MNTQVLTPEWEQVLIPHDESDIAMVARLRDQVTGKNPEEELVTYRDDLNSLLDEDLAKFAFELNTRFDLALAALKYRRSGDMGLRVGRSRLEQDTRLWHLHDDFHLAFAHFSSGIPSEIIHSAANLPVPPFHDGVLPKFWDDADLNDSVKKMIEESGGKSGYSSVARASVLPWVVTIFKGNELHRMAPFNPDLNTQSRVWAVEVISKR